MNKIAGWAAVLGLLVGSMAAPSSHAGEAYPVWWAPELRLESLDEIDAELARRFPEEQRFRLYQFGTSLIWYIDLFPSGDRFHRSYEFTPEDRKRLLDELFTQAEQKRFAGTSDLPADLEAKIKHHISGPFFKYGYRPVKDEQLIWDCSALITWTEHDYGSGSQDAELHDFMIGHCYTWRALKRARPAKTSHLRDFGFTQDVLDYLPALMDAAGCKFLPTVIIANREGVPWGRFVHPAFGPPKYFANLVVRDPEHFVYEAWSSSEMTEKYQEKALSIIGRGDFNEDGLDDLLVRRDYVRFYAGEPVGLPEAVLFLLTRDREGAVLRVIDAYGYRGDSGKSCLDAEVLGYY